MAKELSVDVLALVKYPLAIVCGAVGLVSWWVIVLIVLFDCHFTLKWRW